MTEEGIKALVRTKLVTHEAKKNFQTPDREEVVVSIAKAIVELEIAQAAEGFSGSVVALKDAMEHDSRLLTGE